MLAIAGVDREFAHPFALAAGAGHEVDALQLAAGLGDRSGQFPERLLPRVELDPDRDAVLSADGHRAIESDSLCVVLQGSGAMAFDEALADRVRDLLEPRAEVTERRMFGGIAFMVAGNMAVGVINDDLMVRLDPADAERALAEPHTRPMDFTGTPAKNMVYVDPNGTATDEDLGPWVDAGADFAASLPPK